MEVDEDFGWACPSCTVINSIGRLSCETCGWELDGGGRNLQLRLAQEPALDDTLEARSRAAVAQIWSEASLSILLKLIGNAADHPQEPKFRGPIRKTNGQVRTAIVEVAGASEVLRLAGFLDEPEGFVLPAGADTKRLERIRSLLQDQERTVAGRRVAPVKRRMPRFDEDLLREVKAEQRYNSECRWGQQVGHTAASSSSSPPRSMPPSPLVGPSSAPDGGATAVGGGGAPEGGAMRVRLRLPLGGRLDLQVGAGSSAADLGTMLRERTGVAARHQRLRFGFPPRVLRADSDETLESAGMRDGEVIYLENLRDLFLGNLESGAFTMGELLQRLPPEDSCSGSNGGEEEEASTGALFYEAMQAFGLEPEDRHFWEAVRVRLRLLIAEEASGGRGSAASAAERDQVRAGLRTLRRLFRHHDPRERLAIILDCLPDVRRRNRRQIGSTELRVDRSAFLGSVAPQVLSMTREQLLCPVRVVYVGERGEDAGGLTRDFFSSFATRLGEDEPELWELTGRGSLQPTAAMVATSARHSSRLDSDDLYRACGRVFGIAVLHGCKLGRQLSRSFVRLLLGEPPESLEELQAELRHEAAEGQTDFRARPELLERPLAEFGLEDSLFFACSARDPGAGAGRARRKPLPETELVPGGARIPVTDANKAEWLRLLLRHELVAAAAPAAEAFREGLAEVFGGGGGGGACPLLCLLDAEDLIELWGRGGVSRQDVSRWRAVAQVSSAVERQAEWLWQVLEEDYDDELRGKVLQFATGSSSLGRDGLQSFAVEPADGSDERLPSAMTCGQMLQLPRYSCRAVLSERLRTAVEDCGTFQMA